MSVTTTSIPQSPQRVREYWGDRPMGEVRVKARFTNVVAAALARRGQLPPDQVRAYEADAVVDTGAVRTVLPRHVAELLDLEFTGERVAQYADGRTETVPVTDAVRVELLGRDTVEECLVLGDEVLIGQTVLEKTDLLVDCANARLVPNPEHPDQPISKIRRFTESSVLAAEKTGTRPTAL